MAAAASAVAAAAAMPRAPLTTMAPTRGFICPRHPLAHVPQSTALAAAGDNNDDAAAAR
jgi:hypothetical protein